MLQCTVCNQKGNTSLYCLFGKQKAVEYLDQKTVKQKRDLIVQSYREYIHLGCSLFVPQLKIIQEKYYNKHSKQIIDYVVFGFEYIHDIKKRMHECVICGVKNQSRVIVKCLEHSCNKWYHAECIVLSKKRMFATKAKVTLYCQEHFAYHKNDPNFEQVDWANWERLAHQIIAQTLWKSQEEAQKKKEPEIIQLDTYTPHTQSLTLGLGLGIEIESDYERLDPKIRKPHRAKAPLKLDGKGEPKAKRRPPTQLPPLEPTDPFSYDFRPKPMFDIDYSCKKGENPPIIRGYGNKKAKPPELIIQDDGYIEAIEIEPPRHKKTKPDHPSQQRSTEVRKPERLNSTKIEPFDKIIIDVDEDEPFHKELPPNDFPLLRKQDTKQINLDQLLSFVQENKSRYTQPSDPQIQVEPQQPQQRQFREVSSLPPRTKLPDDLEERLRKIRKETQFLDEPKKPPAPTLPRLAVIESLPNGNLLASQQETLDQKNLQIEFEQPDFSKSQKLYTPDQNLEKQAFLDEQSDPQSQPNQKQISSTSEVTQQVTSVAVPEGDQKNDSKQSQPYKSADQLLKILLTGRQKSAERLEKNLQKSQSQSIERNEDSREVEPIIQEKPKGGSENENDDQTNYPNEEEICYETVTEWWKKIERSYFPDKLPELQSVISGFRLQDARSRIFFPKKDTMDVLMLASKDLGYFVEFSLVEGNFQQNNISGFMNCNLYSAAKLDEPIEHVYLYDNSATLEEEKQQLAVQSIQEVQRPELEELLQIERIRQSEEKHLEMLEIFYQKRLKELELMNRPKFGGAGGVSSIADLSRRGQNYLDELNMSRLYRQVEKGLELKSWDTHQRGQELKQEFRTRQNEANLGSKYEVHVEQEARKQQAEDTFCMVCFDYKKDFSSNNAVLYCQQCWATFHKFCYIFEETQQKCDRCKGRPESRCQICGQSYQTIPTKLVDGEHVHITCALVLGVLRFNGDSFRLSKKDWPEESNKKCFICEQRGGAQLECKACTHSCHLLCAYFWGYRIFLKENAEILCPRHDGRDAKEFEEQIYFRWHGVNHKKAAVYDGIESFLKQKLRQTKCYKRLRELINE